MDRPYYKERLSLLTSRGTEVTSDRNALQHELHDRWHFHAITNSRAHEEVIEQIAFAILSGAYAPGEKLPNMEQLSRAMGVSKPVVGEELKVLTKAKVVRAQRGSSGGLSVLTDNVPDSIM